jgi:nucleoid-associated protein YgaU
MAEEKKKGLFDKAIDALTNRDEKAAAEAKATAAASKAKADAAKLKAEADKKAVQAKMAAEKAAAELKSKADMEKARLATAQAATIKAAQDAAKAAALPKIVKTVEVASGETLSGIALHHYGNASRPYWELIWNANKDVLGDNPNLIKPGMKLRIPELPADMKKK